MSGRLCLRYALFLLIWRLLDAQGIWVGVEVVHDWMVVHSCGVIKLLEALWHLSRVRHAVPNLRQFHFISASGLRRCVVLFNNPNS